MARVDHDGPGPNDDRRVPATLSRRLLWFGALYLAGVLTVLAVAMVLREAIMP